MKCPYCEYEGMVSSVEAHISGKTDEAHRGKVGHGFREDLPRVEDESVDRTETTEPEAPAGGAGSPGWALVGATVLVALVVVASTSTGRTDREETGRVA